MSDSKLIPSAVQNALKVVSPEGLSTLQLRSRRILYIENLEYTKDVYSVIDLTDNDITELSGIPQLPSLEVLLLANNNISRVGAIEESNVRSLSLMNNSLSSFAEIAKLRPLRRLQNLILIGNNITQQHHYRLFTVWLFPELRVLDLQKIKMAEREEGCELFGPDFANRSPAADALLSGNNAVAPTSKDTRLVESTVKSLSPEEKALLVKELEKATSMQDIERISQALKDGYVDTAKSGDKGGA